VSVPPGTTLGIVGANGTGKTTLLRIMSGLLAAQAGSVRVCEQEPGRGLASFVPAGDRGLHWRLTGRANLAFAARLAPGSRRAIDRLVADAAEMVGAAALLSRRVGECSTGQRRRLMLAQALIARPPVLALDEPFADLDPGGMGAVRAVCQGWARAGGVVIVASPIAGELPPADALLRLGDGTDEDLR